MIKHTIKVGESLYRIIEDQAKMTFDYSGAEGKAYLKCCKVTGGSMLPNLLFPGDTIEMPSKSEWKSIKEAAGL